MAEGQSKSFKGDRIYVSSRGLHFCFVDVATAEAFYKRGLEIGRTGLTWEGGDWVIDTNLKGKSE